MNTPATSATAARLGADHGYRFLGDTVELNATFLLTHPGAHDRAWSLQLWACPSAPTRTDELVGHLVAEAPLPPIAEITGASEPFTVTAAAQPPSGGREHSMVLVLASRRSGETDFGEVHDVAAYPARERFVLPRFAGPVVYQVDGDRVRLSVAAIENPREAANLSGTLAVELWGLAAPYTGGRFDGAPLGGVVLGHLAGQVTWSALEFDLAFATPPAHQPHVVAMLREWTGAGFTTRDFVQLPTVPRAAAPAPVAPAPAPGVAAATVAARATASARVSLNTATVAELAAIKGMPRAVAEGIVSKRPFAKLEDVLRVKGMGEKLLAKLRTRLTV